MDSTTTQRRIVIQGVPGAFHEIAARTFFGSDIELVPALSFEALFQSLKKTDVADAAILAIENSIAGSILGNYRLLLEHDMVIAGEVYLRIQQNLLAWPGVALSDIREVHSHPMALAQCAVFFRQYPHIRLVESEDTAESAARIQRTQSRDTAAIASLLAAERYGLSMLAEGIETVPENYTRFLAIYRREDAALVANADKVSLSFTLKHENGSLAQVLNLLALAGVNLTKIQSVPLTGRPWEYHFLLDFMLENSRIELLINELSRVVGDLRVLGKYMGGMKDEV
jgi:prephenate dehydratase